MTAVELAEKIYKHVNSLQRHGESWDKWDDEREIDFIRSLINNHNPLSQTENGSKGSDVTSSQTDENGKPLTYWGGLDKSSQTTSEKYKEYQDWLNEVPEISDEDIEKQADNYGNKWIDAREAFYGFLEGAKWYREQLKSRQ